MVTPVQERWGVPKNNLARSRTQRPEPKGSNSRAQPLRAVAALPSLALRESISSQSVAGNASGRGKTSHQSGQRTKFCMPAGTGVGKATTRRLALRSLKGSFLVWFRHSTLVRRHQSCKVLVSARCALPLHLIPNSAQVLVQR